MCFFAPVYHASMKYAAPVRKEMGTRLSSTSWALWPTGGGQPPAAGVYDENLVEPMAGC